MAPKAKKFVKKAKHFKLTFETDDELNGLVVVMRSVSLGEFMNMTEALSTAGDGVAGSIAVQRTVVQMFADKLVEWNLQDEDENDVPTTLEGVEAQDTDFIMRLYRDWQQAMAGVSAPLASGSPSGEPAQELSIPMDVR